MVTNFPIKPPKKPRPNKITLRPDSVTSEHISPFDYQSKTYVWSGARWVGEITIPKMTEREAGPWRTFLSKLQDQNGTFLIGDESRSFPLGNVTKSITPTVSNVANPPLLKIPSGDVSVVPDDNSLDVTSMTLSCWVRLHTDLTNDSKIISKDGAYSLEYDSTNHEYIASVWINGTKNSVRAGVGEKYNFEHLAVTYDQSELRIYVNGFIQQVASVSGSIDTNSNNLTFGGSSNTDKFRGRLDEIRLWEVSRGQNAIVNDMHKVIPSNSNLSGYWRCDDPQLTDRSNNNNDANIGSDCEIIERQRRSLLTKGWPDDRTDVILQGDYFEIDQRLYQAQETVSSDAGGGLVLVPFPPYRKDYSVDTKLNLDRPVSKFQISSDTGWDVEGIINQELTIPIRENL